MNKFYRGLIKKRRGYHFLNSIDLITYFINAHYADSCVAVLLDCRAAFTQIPKLNILKRDDYSSYLMGLANDHVIIEFANVVTAEDYVFGFADEAKIKWVIYKNGKLVRNEKGLIK
jgi:hypothetical protein